METTRSDRPKRRWMAVSLRGLLLLVLAVALWLGWAVHKARQQRQAVEAVRKFGGFVHYDWEFVDGPVNVPPGNFLWATSWGKLTPKRKPPAPDWLRRALGDEYFQDIAHVSLFVDIEKQIASAAPYNIGPADDALAKLSTQTKVRTLHVGGQQVTDANLAYIGKMTGLEELIIFPGFGLTDAGIAHLAGLKNLRVLLLTNSKVTDNGLKHLAGLTNLQQLMIEGQGLSDEGLAALSGMKDLETLTISVANVTDRGLEHLLRLKTLKRLNLGGKAITDDGKIRLKSAIPGLTIE